MLNSWLNVVWPLYGHWILHKLPNQDLKNVKICLLHAIDLKILLGYLEILTPENCRLEVNKAFSENIFILCMCIWRLLSFVWGPQHGLCKRCWFLVLSILGVTSIIIVYWAHIANVTKFSIVPPFTFPDSWSTTGVRPNAACASYLYLRQEPAPLHKPHCVPQTKLKSCHMHIDKITLLSENALFTSNLKFSEVRISKHLLFKLEECLKIKISQKCFPVYCMQLANFHIFEVLIWQLM